MALKIPPPLLFLLCAGLIYILPTGEQPNHVFRFCSVVFAFLGVMTDLLALYAFRQHRTTISPFHPDKTRCLVTGGIYRITRNPMYLGLVCLLTAWTLWLGNLFGLIVVGGFIGYLTYFQILPEERILAVKFGQVFADYQQKVPRWLG